MKKIWFPAAIILLSILNVGPSLSFAINGDDWLALYRYNLAFTSLLSHLDLRNYLTPTSNYVFGYLMMGLISQLFSYQNFPYYLISLILRIITSFSFYFSIYSITKNRWVGYLSAIFFSSMYAGIETTNWVSNMNTYLSMILLNAFLIFFRPGIYVLSPKTVLLSLLLVTSFLVTPVRMHGLLFFIPEVVFLTLGKINRTNVAKFLGFMTALLLPLVLIRTIYQSGASDYLRIAAADKQTLNIFSNLLTNIGYSIFPNILISQTNSSLFLLIGGGTILLLGIYFFLIRAVDRQLSGFGLLSITASISFLIIPGLINPASIFPSDHRYLIIPGSWLMVGLAIFIVTLYRRQISLLRSFTILLTVSIILLNSFALQKYFGILSKEGRLAKDSDRIFSYIKNKLPLPDNQTPLVFLFLSNDSFFVYNAVNFGFTPHMIVSNHLPSNPQLAPLAVDNFNSLKSIYSDSHSPELRRYGYQPVKIPLQNIYSFYIDSEQIVDYTLQIRQSLTQSPNMQRP